MAILGPGQDGGGGDRNSDSDAKSLKELIDEDSGDSNESQGVRDTAQRVRDQTESNNASDPFDSGSTGSEVISSGGDEDRARSTGSSSGSNDATSTPEKTADDDADGALQDADDDASKVAEDDNSMDESGDSGSSDSGDDASKVAEDDNSMDESGDGESTGSGDDAFTSGTTLENTAGIGGGRRFELSRTLGRSKGLRSNPANRSNSAGGVNRPTLNAILEEEAAQEETARDFGNTGSILPRRPEGGLGELGGNGPGPAEQFSQELADRGAELGADTVEQTYEFFTGKPATGGEKDAARTAGASVGGAPGDLGLLAADIFDAGTFVVTGNQKEGAADSAVVRSGQVADAVANAGVDAADNIIRVDESSTFNDESLRFNDPVFTVEPNKRGELFGSVTAGIATSVTGSAVASKLGLGSDIPGRAINRATGKTDSAKVIREIREDGALIERKVEDADSSPSEQTNFNKFVADDRGQVNLADLTKSRNKDRQQSDASVEDDVSNSADQATVDLDAIENQRSQQDSESGGGSGGSDGGSIDLDKLDEMSQQKTPDSELSGTAEADADSATVDLDKIDQMQRRDTDTSQSGKQTQRQKQTEAEKTRQRQKEDTKEQEKTREAEAAAVTTLTAQQTREQETQKEALAEDLDQLVTTTTTTDTTQTQETIETTTQTQDQDTTVVTTTTTTSDSTVKTPETNFEAVTVTTDIDSDLRESDADLDLGDKRDSRRKLDSSLGDLFSRDIENAVTDLETVDEIATGGGER